MPSPHELILVLFDVDGTLSDSRGGITEAMGKAFEEVALRPPATEQLLNVVGLSLLDQAERLIGADQASLRGPWVEAYKTAYQEARRSHGARAHAPLFYGVRDMLEVLARREDVIMGLATGKSQRGLDAFVEAHELQRIFVTFQCADHHPSKPDPSMVRAAMDETGMTAPRTLVVGDTTFDVDMAHSAGARALAVGWGFHGRGQLRHAEGFAHSVEEIPRLIDEVMES